MSACVAVHFGVKYKYVDIFVLCQYVVKSAVTDVVCPSVTAEDPNGLLDKYVLVLDDFCGKVLAALAVSVSFEVCKQLSGCGLACLGVVKACKPFFASGNAFGVLALFLPNSKQCFNVFLQFGTTLFECKVVTETEFGVVFKQAVCPCRSVTFLVDGVGAEPP